MDLYSIDLSAATDRLPLSIQIIVIYYLFERKELSES